VIENNGYAMGTSVQRTSNVHNLHTLGEAYDMPSESVDAMKVEEVHNAVAKAAERARKGEGPTLLEFRTYRYKGHSMSDPAKYRTKEEVEAYKRRDPLEQVKLSMKKYGFGDDDYFAAVEKKVKAQVAECVTFAEESDFPDPGEVYDDIYVQEDYPFIKE
jgi:pyruvate dehydrogenase E1 component alpha subunit